METLLNTYKNRLAQTDNTFVRYLMPQIHWGERLTGIIGARGTGKTTLMLQYIKQNLDITKAVYVSLDDLYFANNRLVDLAYKLWQEGITNLFIDEVHKYPYNTWAQELKNIYDSYPEICTVFSGSSILKIYEGNADLSRRAVEYELFGLSFREFLASESIKNMPAISLEDLLKRHVEIASDITNGIKIMPLFRKYLQSGYFPYYKEGLTTYSHKLANTVSAVLETDLPATERIEFTSVQKLKRLLTIIAGLAPFAPNMSQLGAHVDILRNNLPKSLLLLERARMLGLLRANGKNLSPLSKPAKIYLDNPNLAFALGNENTNIGSLRETFFYNQLRIVSSVTDAQRGDFTVNGQLVFEVGGKSKTFAQIANIPDSYLAIDEVEIGIGNRIPLWMFGLLY
ncbi:MAG: AAA family ATPase [Prevotellaceae bacterium]|jgi:predicted AAA+ superfamily ATPase|nr:AAA family ATPase [Prevotellaceae bacterium]